MFTALDLVSIQTQTRVEGRKVRRNKNLTEINFYDAENDEINVQDVYQWQAETDEFLRMSDSNTLEEIRFDRGWTRSTLDEEIFKRQAVLAYLIENGLNTYTQVAATVQAFINDEETILALMAEDRLERSLEDLREMESVLIDIDPEKEAMVPRPDPSEEALDLCADILDRADSELFDDYRGEDVAGIDTALAGVDTAADVTADSGTASTPDDEFVAAEPTDVDEATGPDTDGSTPSEDDDFGISFDSSSEVDDWGSDDGEEEVDEGSLDRTEDVDEVSVDADDGEPPDAKTGSGETDDSEPSTPDADAEPDADADAESESEADIDEWGFGDVTEADDEGD